MYVYFSYIRSIYEIKLGLYCPCNVAKARAGLDAIVHPDKESRDRRRVAAIRVSCDWSAHARRGPAVIRDRKSSQ